MKRRSAKHKPKPNQTNQNQNQNQAKPISGIFLRPLRNLCVFCVLPPHSSPAKPISGIFCDFCVVFAPFAFGSRTRTRIRTRSKALFIV